MLTLQLGYDLEIQSHASSWQNDVCASLQPAQGMVCQVLARDPAFRQVSQHYSQEVGSSTSGKPSACPLLEHDLACPAKPDRLLGSAAPCAYPESSCAAAQGWGAHRELGVHRALRQGERGQAHSLHRHVFSPHKLLHRGSAFKASPWESHSSKMKMRLTLFK